MTVPADILRCIEAAEKHQKKLALDWQRSYEVYLGQRQDKSRSRRKQAQDDWRSKVDVKHVFQQVETLIPEFLIEDPNFEVRGRERSDDASAKTVQQLLDYQLDRDRYAEKRMQAVKKAIIFGACPIKVTWAFERKRMKVRNPASAEERLASIMAGVEVPPYVEQDVTLRDDPTMIVVDPFDFMWDPAATSIDDAQYVLHRSWLTADQLRAKEAAGLYSGVSKHLDKQSKGGGFGDKVGRLFGESEEQAEAKRGDRHEVIEKWTRDKLVVILDRKVVVRDTENPYWHNQIPFVMAQVQPDVDKMVGHSLVWSIEALQDLANGVLNAQQDALQLILDPPMALRSNDPRLKELVYRPGTKVLLDDPRAINVLDIGQASSYATTGEVDRLVGWMERTTGINASVAGSSNEGTATEAAMNLRQGKSRIAMMVSCVDAAFARAAEQFIQLDQQFIDNERVIRIVGLDAAWAEIGPQDIAGMYDVRAKNSTERTIKELAREQSLNLLNVGMQLAALGYDIDPLVQKAMQVHDADALSRVQAAAPAVDPAAGQPVQDPQAMEQAQNPDGLDNNGFAPDALTQG